MQLWCTVLCRSHNDLPHGGFPDHEIHYITASLLMETCHNVATEPPLKPLNGETLSARSANTDDNACFDIRAQGFWNNHQDAFLDVRVFYPNPPSNHSTDAYRRHEMAKKQEYRQRVREVKRGVFIPLVLSTNGRMGKKRQHPYSRVMGWLRCRLSFASIRSSIMCIQEAAHRYTDPYTWTISHLHLRRGMYPA